ncbi:permease-like cell division protein FtsX [Dactylosporangium sp. AC04546]|uniref:permease-like cell division protein FtsX n=1 Tax=Dactylosporangium sp. AC04546 TaxID=2862460 RepID=UPI001EDD1027|nr:permease-like cell division protein FtsX [Dactylosporangium sp. AC04546]WVK82941.1 permease-like cell division protein FtsX [Dactylosporangium sp. AC04546]
MRVRYVLSEVLTGLWRNVTMTIAMIITMTVSLTMLGASLLLFFQVDKMENFFYQRVEVSVFLKVDVTEEQRSNLKSAIESNPLVKTVEYESKKQAWERFQTQFKDAPDLVNATKEESLPESFRIKLKDPNAVKQFSDEIRTQEGISDIVDQKELLTRVFDLLGALQTLALTVAIVQGAAALLLVANTIQVAAYSKRREVAVMKLVGASNWFIQLPFVLEAVFAGVIGAILGFGTLVAAKVFIIDGSLKALTNVLLPVDWGNILLMLPLLAGAGGLVSAVTAWVTLRFYVRV